MTSEEFEALKIGTIEERDLQIRQVSNGFVLVGNRRFLDDVTHTNRFSIGIEGVAETNQHALDAVVRFYTTGDLAGTAA